MHTLRFLNHSRPGSFLLIGWALAVFLIPTPDHDVIAASLAADASTNYFPEPESKGGWRTLQAVSPTPEFSRYFSAFLAIQRGSRS